MVENPSVAAIEIIPVGAAITGIQSSAIDLESETAVVEASTDPVQRLDVNADGSVSPLDVLNVINRLAYLGTSFTIGAQGEGANLR